MVCFAPPSWKFLPFPGKSLRTPMINNHVITLGTRNQELAVAGTGREVPNLDERQTR